MLPSFSPGRTDGGANYLFEDPFTSRFTSDSEATAVLHGMDRPVPSGHPVGWYFSEIDEDFFGSNADLVRLRASLSGWGMRAARTGTKCKSMATLRRRRRTSMLSSCAHGR